MELMLMPIAMMAIFVVWHFVWLPTCLSAARDRLFDLRDEVVRQHFISHKIPLSHPMYKELRDFVNDRIRYLDRVGMVGFIGFVRRLKANPELERELHARSEQRDAKVPVEFRDLNALVQNKAGNVTINYMIESSLICVVGAFFIGVFLAIQDAFGMCGKLIKGLRPALDFAKIARKAALEALFVTSRKQIKTKNEAIWMIDGAAQGV